jgi:hypothetical protein
MLNQFCTTMEWPWNFLGALATFVMLWTDSI